MKPSLVRPAENLADFFLAILFFGVLSLISPTGGTIANAQSGAVRPQATTPNRAKPPAAGQSTVKGRVVYKDNAQPLKGLRLRIFTPEDAPGSGQILPDASRTPIVTEEFIKNQAANTRRVVIAFGEQKVLDLPAQ